MVGWDARALGDWADEIDGADAVINLAGRSVNCRYTPSNRRSILESRVDSTRVVGEAVARATRPPRVWLQAGTATVYAHRHDAPNDEATGVLGGSEPDAPDAWRFSVEVASAWERALDGCETPHTRKVVLRSAMMMSPDRGGVFDTLLGLVRLGLGGRAGDGRQYVSWVHDADFVRAVDWLIAHEEVEGPVNIASPEPAAERRVHACPAAGVGRPVRAPGGGVGARSRRGSAGDRDGTGPEEPPGGPGSAAGRRLPVPVPGLVGGCRRPVSPLAAGSPWGVQPRPRRTRIGAVFSKPVANPEINQRRFNRRELRGHPKATRVVLRREFQDNAQRPTRARPIQAADSPRNQRAGGDTMSSRRAVPIFVTFFLLAMDLSTMGEPPANHGSPYRSTREGHWPPPARRPPPPSVVARLGSERLRHGMRVWSVAFCA